MNNMPMLGVLGQPAQQMTPDQKRMAVANQLLQGATTPQQTGSWGGVTAQALSGALGGYMANRAQGQMSPVQKAYYGMTTTGWY